LAIGKRFAHVNRGEEGVKEGEFMRGRTLCAEWNTGFSESLSWEGGRLGRRGRGENVLGKTDFPVRGKGRPIENRVEIERTYESS